MLLDDPKTEQRCRELVEAIALPEPFCLEALTQAVASIVGRPVALRAVEEIEPGVTAVVVDQGEQGYVVTYVIDGDPWRALTLVAHEFGHILCGHTLLGAHAPGEDCPTHDHPPHQPALHGLPYARTGEPTAAGPPSIRRGAATPLLLASGFLDSCGGHLFRCDLTAPHEREAEYLATLLVERVDRLGLLHEDDVPQDADAARYTRALLGTSPRTRRRAGR